MSEYSGMLVEGDALFFAIIIPIYVSEFGCCSHDLASLQGIVGLEVYLVRGLHLPRWRFSLYLEV
jgi:hypothetical protein